MARRHKQPLAILLTCEHGGNDVPPEYAAAFAGADAVLASHRGWDPGSLELAEYLAAELPAPLIAATVTRLLVELNRSRHHPRLFSEFSRPLPSDTRQQIINRCYTPHIERVRSSVASLLSDARQVLHLGVHTFTPVFDGVPRNCDVGLLYDSRRSREADFCRRWQQALRDADPQLRVRRNFPYRGSSDGLTTTLRSEFPEDRYLGIELEVAHDWPLHRRREWPTLRRHLLTTLQSACEARKRSE